MQVFRQILHEYQFKCFGILGRDCRQMFSIRAKQQPIPSINASDSSKFQFYICFLSFQPDFLSVFHDEDTVPPQELRIGCQFPCQAADKLPLCSILSASLTPFAVWMPKKMYRISVRFVLALNQPLKNLNNTIPSPSFHRPNKKPRKQHAPPNLQAED